MLTTKTSKRVGRLVTDEWRGVYKVTDAVIAVILFIHVLKFWFIDESAVLSITAGFFVIILLVFFVFDFWSIDQRLKSFFSAYLIPAALSGLVLLAAWRISPLANIWFVPVMMLIFMRLPVLSAQAISLLGIGLLLAIDILKWQLAFDVMFRIAVSGLFILLILSLFFKVTYRITKKLRETTELLESAQQSISQGLIVIGADTRIKMFNQRASQLLDIPAEVYASKPLLSEIVSFQTERGDFGVNHSLVDESAIAYIASLGLDKNLKTPEKYIRKDRNGRFIEVQTNTMPSGDVVRTYTDVTVYHQMNAQLKDVLEDYKELSKKVLQNSREKMVAALTQLSLIRDNETGLHIKRTQLYLRTLADELVRSNQFTEILNEKFIDQLVKAAPMHDLGKVGIPDSILLKPGRHTTEERTIMRTHAQLGENILQVVAETTEASDSLFVIAANIAGGHHENWDGSGYPRGIADVNIPLEARLMALADVYDALTTDRAYKKRWSHEQAVSEITRLEGIKFDPEVVAAFKRSEEQFRAISMEWAEQSTPAAP